MAVEKDSKIEEATIAIQERINKGIYSAGQRLPAERTLAEELNVSRVTIHAALSRLQAANLIDIVPRGGAFVRSFSTKQTMGKVDMYTASGPELKNAGSFIRAMQLAGKETQVRFIVPSTILPAGDALSEKMDISPKVKLLRRYRIHLVERMPYRILDSYYLASLLGELHGKDEGYIPLFKWLRDNKGLQATKALEKLNCRMPAATEATLLNISRNQPVVDMERWVWANTSVLFEYSHIVANAALHEFAYTYNIDEEASK